MEYTVGMRVFAMQKADTERIYLFGFGTYEGRHDPEGSKGTIFTQNPRIRLDNGEVVWGYECWWGPESEFEAYRNGREVVTVRVEDRLPYVREGE